MARRLFVRLEEDAVHGPETLAPAGTLRACTVSPPLQRFVSHVLAYAESIPEGEEVVERVLPDGAVRLVISAATGPGGAPLVAIGPSSTPALIRLRGHLRGLSLTLQPGAAMPVLGVPAGELNDAVVPLDALWDRETHDRLAERLDRASTDAERLGAVENTLLDCATRRATDPHPAAVIAWRRIVETQGAITVGQVAARLGVGERRLQQLFRQAIGLPPRTWRRLARMHGLIRGLRRDAPRWADAAARYGFYDQAHLVREFKDLCGCTPGEFLNETTSGSSKTRR